EPGAPAAPRPGRPAGEPARRQGEGLVRAFLRSAALPAFGALLFLAAGAAEATIGVRSSLSPEVVGVDEVVTYSIEVHGGGFSHLAFEPPTLQMENLEVAAGPFQSESISFVNGNFSRMYKLSWQLRPLGVGRARVHAVSLRLGAQTLELPNREVRVQQEPTRPPEDPDQEPDPLDRFFGGHLPLRRLLDLPERPPAPPRV